MRKARLLKRLWEGLQAIDSDLDCIQDEDNKDREVHMDCAREELADMIRLVEHGILDEAQKGNLTIETCTHGHFHGVHFPGHDLDHEEDVQPSAAKKAHEENRRLEELLGRKRPE